jgi:hypothetical protein
VGKWWPSSIGGTAVQNGNTHNWRHGDSASSQQLNVECFLVVWYGVIYMKKVMQTWYIMI